MEFNGTSGEWKVDNNDWIVSEEQSQLICTVDSIETVEGGYNAQLIATAPESLEQNQASLRLFKRIKDRDGFEDVGGHVGAAIHRLEKVINKSLNNH